MIPNRGLNGAVAAISTLMKYTPLHVGVSWGYNARRHGLCKGVSSIVAGPTNFQNHSLHIAAISRSNAPHLRVFLVRRFITIRRRSGIPGAAQGVFRITLAYYPRRAIRACSWRFPNLPATAAPDARQRLVSRELTGSVGSPGDQGSRAPSARSSALRTIARWRRSSAGRRRGGPRVTDWFS